MSHPDGLPDLFVDRSLGRIQLPRLLKVAGLLLTTLAERYGIPADETVSDETWLRDAGQRGEAVLMKDERVRYRPVEKAAILDHGLRAFCLARRDLAASDMAQLFLSNLDGMTRACRETSSGLFVISRAGVRKVHLDR